MRACARFYFRRKLRAWMYSLMVDFVLDTSQGLQFTGAKKMLSEILFKFFMNNVMAFGKIKLDKNFNFIIVGFGVEEKLIDRPLKKIIYTPVFWFCLVYLATSIRYPWFILTIRCWVS